MQRAEISPCSSCCEDGEASVQFLLRHAAFACGTGSLVGRGSTHVCFMGCFVG